MPCFTRQTSTVEFGATTDVNVLAQALRGLGFTVTVDTRRSAVGSGAPQSSASALRFTNTITGQTGTFVNGTLTIESGMKEDMNVFKRAYSAEVVRAASKRFGWQVKETGANTFQVQRRA